MKHLTEHLWFETPHRRDYLNIKNTVAQLVRKSGVQEGLCLVNAIGPAETVRWAALLYLQRLRRRLGGEQFFQRA